MRNENLPELCITVDDKQCPLKWLKRYLTKHNFYCVIYRPDKERKSELTKKAEKSCAKITTNGKRSRRHFPSR